MRTTHVILVAEDDVLIRHLLMDFLSDAGFTVVEAATADDALHVLADHRDVDLVCTDINMPGAMDGRELADWLHTHRPGMPVVLTSGFATFPVSADDFQRRRFISKPYVLEELERQIRDLLH